ncbi:LacI family DNA-binding transcriptional regulator [Georgenia halophila]|uniref:LacI family DNA-binding transcriptional regulator n=1 Tax=Georgenia halophila TaxID=620889 RepID=A0ABP8LKN1_9MICO
MKRATIYSIAEELGISASTVSRAFTRPELVKRSVRERILATAEQLGYEPSWAARGLATGRTGLIGLLIPDITNPFFPPLVRAIEKAAAGRGSGVLLVDAEANGAAEPGLVAQLKPQVEGLIIASPRAPSAALKEAVGQTPAVVVNRAMRGLPTVVVDNGPALREAVRNLVADGHHKLVVMRGPADAWAAARRVEAVRAAAGQEGAELVELGPFEAQFEDGRRAAREILASGATGVLAFDDLMACGVLSGLAERGRRVPDDFSLVGCDDVLLARTVTPALTTITAPLEELGNHVVERLDGVARGEAVKDVRVRGELTVRGTTAPAPGTS